MSNDSDKEDYTAATQVETRSAAMSIDGVDFGQRIITVLAVPYEQPTKVPFQQGVWNEVFSRSAFNGIEARAQRVPATAVFEIPAPDHRGGRLVGRVIRADSHDSAGLITDVKISETDLGTELLQLARDDALSASIGFMVKNPYRDQELNRQNLTRRINKAFLDHLAFVGQPAYEGTRILAMRAEDQRSESQMPAFASTPKMDQYLNDPILRWASEQVQK